MPLGAFSMWFITKVDIQKCVGRLNSKASVQFTVVVLHTNDMAKSWVKGSIHLTPLLLCAYTYFKIGLHRGMFDNVSDVLHTNNHPKPVP